mmetsp:Transcript_46702/g.129983  ORF Transcript_46702/g.129983 Transcript_46702/m.129983 type:complete len:200 (+) Transcript_46702:1234-1833(+)
MVGRSLERRVIQSHADRDHLLDAGQCLCELFPFDLNLADCVEDGYLQSPVPDLPRQRQCLLCSGKSTLCIFLLKKGAGQQMQRFTLPLLISRLSETCQGLLHQLHSCLRLFVLHVCINGCAQELCVPCFVWADFLSNRKRLLRCAQCLLGSILTEMQLGNCVVHEGLHLFVAKLRESSHCALEGLQCSVKLLIVEARYP